MGTKAEPGSCGQERAMPEQQLTNDARPLWIYTAGSAGEPTEEYVRVTCAEADCPQCRPKPVVAAHLLAGR